MVQIILQYVKGCIRKYVKGCIRKYYFAYQYRQ
jgi:hypothetical protein